MVAFLHRAPNHVNNVNFFLSAEMRPIGSLRIGEVDNFLQGHITDVSEIKQMQAILDNLERNIRYMKRTSVG